ncbi:MAG: alpha/beta fold hydrolase [Maricaulaceae bacterium]
MKQAEAINMVYELISEPKLFKTFVEKIVAYNDIDPELSGIKTALKNSADLATKIVKPPDIDLSRDIGVIVVGLDHKNQVSHVPPGLSDWVGAKFIGDKNGIGWVEIEHDERKNVAHILDIDAHDHLPIHKSLHEAFQKNQISKLIILHQFVLSSVALNALKQLYNLTDSEMQLCNLLSKGNTLAECSEITNVKKSTSRTHLKNIFSKIGVNNQSALIRILTQISAAAAIQDFGRKKNIPLAPDWHNGLVSQQTLIFKSRFNTKVTYSKYGDPNGRPVLFFHCGFGARHHSRQMAQAAKDKGLLIYKFDRPGFGHSELVPDMSIKSIAAVTEDLLEHLNLKSIDAIGFGIGGRTLIDSLQYLSGRIKSATLYSFRGVIEGYKGSLMKRMSYLIWHRPKIFIQFVRIARLHSSNGVAAGHLREYFRDSEADKAYLSDDDTLTQMLTEMHLATRQDFQGSYFEHLNLKAPLPEFSLPAYDIPINFIYGDKDPFNTYEDNQRLIDLIPKAQINTIKNKGQLFITHNFKAFLKEAKI